MHLSTFCLMKIKRNSTHISIRVKVVVVIEKVDSIESARHSPIVKVIGGPAQVWNSSCANVDIVSRLIYLIEASKVLVGANT